MIVCKSFKEVAEVTNSKEWEVMKGFEQNSYRGLFFINDIEVKIEAKDKELHFLILDWENDSDCKQYFMEYELKNLKFKVYTDGIVGLEECKLIDCKNNKREITRATVITESGTELNRICKFIIDEGDEDYKNDGCIYYWER